MECSVPVTMIVRTATMGSGATVTPVAFWRTAMPTQEPSQNSPSLKPARPRRLAKPVPNGVLDRDRRAARIWVRGAIRAAVSSTDHRAGENGSAVHPRAA